MPPLGLFGEAIFSHDLLNHVVIWAGLAILLGGSRFAVEALCRNRKSSMATRAMLLAAEHADNVVYRCCHNLLSNRKERTFSSGDVLIYSKHHA